MTNNRLTLREVAQAVLTKHDVSGRQLDALARKRGLTISYTTINAMAAGTYRSTPSDKTLDALVSLSGIPEADVYEAAKRPVRLAPLADRLPVDADSLSGEQQEAVLAVVRQFAKANRALRKTREDVGNDDRSASTSQAGARPAKSASDSGPSKDQLDELRRRQHEADTESVEHITKQAADRDDGGE